MCQANHIAITAVSIAPCISLYLPQQSKVAAHAHTGSAVQKLWYRGHSTARLSTVSWASVKELDLTQSCQDAAGVAALVKGSWASLKIPDDLKTELTLSSVGGNQLDTAAVAQLIQGCWPCSYCLELGRDKLDNAAVTQLQQAQWPILCKLVLSRNPLVTAEIGAAILDQWPLLVDI